MRVESLLRRAASSKFAAETPWTVRPFRVSICGLAPMNRLTTILLVLIGAPPLVAPVFAADEVDVSKLPPPSTTFDFEKQVKPLLETACVGCHGLDKQKGKFRI